MKVLGIDPGLERVGWGLIDKQGSRLIPIAHGLILTPRVALQDRLALIHQELTDLITEHRPDMVGMEKLFFAKNQTTVMDVARASGVILLACGQQGLGAREFSPPEVKLSVVGNGSADKKQVQFMVTRLLGLAEAPKPDDVADALAVAITCALKGQLPQSP